jgi:DNA polymerase/3'-5' exonuclease PolX
MATAKDFKPIIIDALTVLMKSDQIRKEKFKVIAYQKVIKELQNHEGPIRTMEDIEGIKGIGKKIQAKIEEILTTGELAAAAQAAAELPIDVYDQLLKIHGIGPVKARKLIEDFGVKSIEDLRSKSAADLTL